MKTLTCIHNLTRSQSPVSQKDAGVNHETKSYDYTYPENNTANEVGMDFNVIHWDASHVLNVQ